MPSEQNQNLSGPYPQPPQEIDAPSVDMKNQAVIFTLLAILFGIIAAVIGYLISSDKPWLRRQMVELLNLQITMTIVIVASVVMNATVILALIGVPLLILAGIWNLVVLIIGTSKASEGKFYKYPFTFHLLS